MNHIIYYRKSLFQEELESAQKYFQCVDLISNIPMGRTIIGRFSLWPFFSDQEKDIKNIGSNLINSHEQYQYIADLQNYVYDLKDYTPRTWDKLHEIPENIPVILKGETNSKKGFWNEMMFAKNKKEAIEVHSNLCKDGLIGEQKIYIREYIPLVTFDHGIGGIPITKEFRIFVCYGQIVVGGFYWQNYYDDLKNSKFRNELSENNIPEDFINKIIKIIGNKSNFYTIDIAQTQKGNWIIIELNEGMQAGLSTIDPDLFYCNLHKIIKEKESV